ncbi:MAG: dihydroorotate dehydrogenase electron transfer subunit [Nitriliruptor sp.]
MSGARIRAGQVMGRADASLPVKATCEVLARRRQGAYWLLSISAPEIADRAEPGQFVDIAVEGGGSLLRRPFSIARVSKQGPFAGTLDVVFDAHGPGTEWLTTHEPHDVLDVVGPLGNPFPLPKRKVPCLLVGGGYGTAPLFFLADRLSREGQRVDLIVGAASQDRLLDVIEAKRSSASVTFTTEDGSYGERGRVTDVLADVAARCGSAVVYACGPNPMLRAVSELCVELELPVQVAVEEKMACGIGVCFTCVLPIRGKDGSVRMKRSCMDGPVFNGAKVAWEESRYAAGPQVTDEEPADDEPAEKLTDADLWGDT